MIKNPATASLTFRRCDLGSADYEYDRLIDLKGTVNLYHCRLLQPLADGTLGEEIVRFEAANATLRAEYCIFQGGNKQVDIFNTGSDTDIINCLMYGYQSTGVQSESGTNTIPFIKNTIFWNEYEAGTQFAIRDSVGLTETDAEINNNCFFGDGGLATIANGGGSDSLLATDPVFVDPASNFRLQRTSPCINAGVPVAVVHSTTTTQDPDGNFVHPVLGEINIGVYNDSTTVKTIN